MAARIKVPWRVVAVALLAGGIAQAVTFEVGFDGLPEQVGASPGETARFDAYVTLTTTDNETPDGAQGWLSAVGARGGSIVGVSLEGLKISTIYDEDPDGNGPLPLIHHDPFEVDMGTLEANGGFVRSHVCFGIVHQELRQESLGEIGVSALVLNMIEKMVLQPLGTQRILRLTVETPAPREGDCAEVELYAIEQSGVICVDAFGNPKICGVGGAVITHNGGSYQAALTPGHARVCVTSFRRGDANADARVDISDAVFVLSYLFLGGSEPACRDAADAGDDGVLDLSDGVLILNRLFAIGPGTVIPPPGIYACGTDETPDALSCAESAGC